jgi:hypothetical protein
MLPAINFDPVFSHVIHSSIFVLLLIQLWRIQVEQVSVHHTLMIHFVRVIIVVIKSNH